MYGNNMNNSLVGQCDKSLPFYAEIHYSEYYQYVEINEDMRRILKKLNCTETIDGNVIFVTDNRDVRNYLRYLIDTIKCNICSCKTCIFHRSTINEQMQKYCEKIDLVNQYHVFKEIGVQMYTNIHSFLSDPENYYYLDLLPKIEKIMQQFKSLTPKYKIVNNPKFTKNDYECFIENIQNYFYNGQVKELHSIARFKLLLTNIDKTITFEE